MTRAQAQTKLAWMLSVTSHMRVPWLIVSLALVSSCASTDTTRQSLAPLLPDPEPDTFRFFHGSWIWPDSIYAFQLSEQILHVAEPTLGLSAAQAISVDDCPEIAEGYLGMLSAVSLTAKIASGEIAIERPTEVVMDGPDYRIEFWSRAAATTLVLSGGGNSQIATPWIDAALEVRAIGKKCGGR